MSDQPAERPTPTIKAPSRERCLRFADMEGDHTVGAMSPEMTERQTPITDEFLLNRTALRLDSPLAEKMRNLERQLAEAREKIERQGEHTAAASLDPMMERALRAEKRLGEALALAESNGKLAHDTAIELREVREQRDRLADAIKRLLNPADPERNSHTALKKALTSTIGGAK